MSGRDVSTGQRAGAAGGRGRRPGERRRSIGSGACLPTRRFRQAGPVSLVRSSAPGGARRWRSGFLGLCRGLIGPPGRRARVPRGCRARAAEIDLPPRGARGVLPAWVRVPARGLARGEEDGYQPCSQQDEDNRGHDEHRRKRHGRTRVSQEIPFLRRQAAGCCSRSPPGTGHRGRGGSRRPGCAALRVAKVTGRADSREWNPAADLHKFLTW